MKTRNTLATLLIVMLIMLMIATASLLCKGEIGNLIANSNTNVINQEVNMASYEPTITPAITPEPTEEPIQITTYVDSETGKAFFTTVELALKDNDLQARLDAAEMSNYHVYDVMKQGDLVVTDATGAEITASTSLNIYNWQQVNFLRDGDTVMVYSYLDNQFKKEYGNDHAFRKFNDSAFTANVLCKEHMSLRASHTVSIGYIDASEWGNETTVGCKGKFTVTAIDADIFKSFVLVKRTITTENGQLMDMYTWCVRICGDDGVIVVDDGGKSGPTVVDPTDTPATPAPTTPAPVTPAPTTPAPTTPAPTNTHSVTPAPETTHSPTDNPETPTTPEPETTKPGYRATPKPEITPAPTNNHSSNDEDEGSGNTHSSKESEEDNVDNKHSGSDSSEEGNTHTNP